MVFYLHKISFLVKHLRIDDKIENHTSLDVVSKLAGHTTKQMTARYSKKFKKVYAEEISEKSQGFLE